VLKTVNLNAAYVNYGAGTWLKQETLVSADVVLRYELCHEAVKFHIGISQCSYRIEKPYVLIDPLYRVGPFFSPTLNPIVYPHSGVKQESTPSRFLVTIIDVYRYTDRQYRTPFWTNGIHR
jgi:hypothetical protein